MKKKSVMVSIRHHQGPMYSILKRANIGIPDKYGRGTWIKESDIPAIKSYFQEHGTKAGYDWWLNGSNQHNQVMFTAFLDLMGVVDDEIEAARSAAKAKMEDRFKRGIPGLF